MHSGCVILGQTILRYKVPYNIFNAINGIYEKNFNSLNKVNDFLAGKIEKEHSLYYDGNDITEDKMSPHNLLPKNISNYLLRAFENYMKFYNGMFVNMRQVLMLHIYSPTPNYYFPSFLD